MTADEFRRHGRTVVDWIADYMQRVEELPVLSRSQPGEVQAALPSAPPDEGEPFDRILADLDEVVVPGLTHWQSPNFFGYFPANTSGPSILGELVSAGLGVQGMLWSTSPACTELETRVLDWVVDLLGLPERFRSDGPGGGVIQDSASSATLCALLAARHRTGGGDARQMTVYASEQAHSSVEKAARIAGFAYDAVRFVQTDAAFAMDPRALNDTVAADVRDGFTPCMVTATVGTTGSNAIDPVGEIARVCRDHETWLHVDAAMSGTAGVCPEFRWLHNGVEAADSYCFNPHKWMFTNFDCDCFYVADREPLVAALSILPEYLRNNATVSGEVVDYRDWQVPLGRRFRALKLWFVIRHYGVEGLRRHVRRHVELAQQFAQWVQDDPDWELAVDPPLNLVCLRHRAGDAVTEAVLQRANATGRMFVTHTRLDGRYVIRVSIGQTHTEQRHVEQAWCLLRDSAAAVLAEP
ncbi:MAG: aspartate aminotransferase family protein [Nitriliruptorales bacterium]|nr:aspartate aminotransferase family protein [Nitriliruptorales bacterium]